MATVHDVAAYILQRAGAMSTFRLQKLVYFGQAWSLAQCHAPLFPNRVEAWTNGPVSPELYAVHKGRLAVSNALGDPAQLKPAEREYMDGVLEFYSQFDDGELVLIAHKDQPWQDARAGLPADQQGQVEIPQGAMASYYQAQLAELDKALRAAARPLEAEADGWVAADEFLAGLGV